MVFLETTKKKKKKKKNIKSLEKNNIDPKKLWKMTQYAKSW